MFKNQCKVNVLSTLANLFLVRVIRCYAAHDRDSGVPGEGQKVMP